VIFNNDAVSRPPPRPPAAPAQTVVIEGKSYRMKDRVTDDRPNKTLAAAVLSGPGGEPRYTR